MARYGVKTILSPEQALQQAMAFFGAEGLGLKATQEGRCGATFVGEEGHIVFAATEGEPKTIVELMTCEWDHEVKQFVRKIARQTKTCLELAKDRALTGQNED